jgi:hypothetical protein
MQIYADVIRGLFTTLRDIDWDKRLEIVEKMRKRTWKKVA